MRRVGTLDIQTDLNLPADLKYFISKIIFFCLSVQLDNGLLNSRKKSKTFETIHSRLTFNLGW